MPTKINFREACHISQFADVIVFEPCSGDCFGFRSNEWWFRGIKQPMVEINREVIMDEHYDFIWIKDK